MAGWDEQFANLEAEFPGWHIWRSDAGRWWATRTGVVPRREPLGAGRVMTGQPVPPACGQSCAHRLCKTLWITGLV